MDLRKGDLRNLVDKILEIDSYKSKMGEDKDIITLAFSVRTHDPAKDLMKFLESGYPFILDADVTPGEQRDGFYRVFVEIERSKQAPEQILEIAYGVKELAELEDLKFRYYKNFKSVPLTDDTITEQIPVDSASYEERISQTRLENYKNFFNKSYLESLEMYDDTVILKKAFADPIAFKVEEIGDVNSVTVTESFNVNAFPEILFLTKYIGDYNISKYGESIFFENENKILKTRRL